MKLIICIQYKGSISSGLSIANKHIHLLILVSMQCHVAGVVLLSADDARGSVRTIWLNPLQAKLWNLFTSNAERDQIVLFFFSLFCR